MSPPIALRSMPIDCGRPAFTLAELVVALAVGGAAFGAFALVVAHEERAHSELARRVRARAQLQEGMAALVAELRAVSTRERDIPAGGARDSSIEFRATVGTATVCDIRERSIVLGLASFVALPTAGDTTWAYVRGPEPGWIALPIAGLETIDASHPSSCVLPANASAMFDGARRGRPRYGLVVAAPPPATVAAGTPVRVTRPVRYSLYRAPDGRWYLGRREWSAATGRFETIQPVSGPYRAFAPPAHGTSGLDLAFLDELGAELPSGTPETTRIARVVITLRAPPVTRDGRVIERRDAASATLALRNRK